MMPSPPPTFALSIWVELVGLMDYFSACLFFYCLSRVITNWNRKNTLEARKKKQTHFCWPWIENWLIASYAPRFHLLSCLRGPVHHVRLLHLLWFVVICVDIFRVLRSCGLIFSVLLGWTSVYLSSADRKWWRWLNFFLRLMRGSVHQAMGKRNLSRTNMLGKLNKQCGCGLDEHLFAFVLMS